MVIKTSTRSWTTPEPGDVVHYRYLWADEAGRGREDGRKDRPCLVLAATQSGTGIVVRMLPITTQNFDPGNAIALPERVATMLALNPKSVIVLREFNRFVWVGPDVVPLRGGTPFYGKIPPALFERVVAAFLRQALRQVVRSL